jgi:hypothetical protein
MTIKVQLSTTPVDENGKGETHDISDEEFVDLSRMGLIVPGKGDVQDDGTLKPKAAKEASLTAQNTTGVQPVLTREG